MSKLFLIPVPLGESGLSMVIPAGHKAIIASLSHFIVENIRTARRFLKKIDRNMDIDSLQFFELNKHTDKGELSSFLKPIKDGNDIGLMSEAGCPGIADPGADLVRVAHQQGIRLMPLVGPSSLLLAMMASGMNGQNFAFNGYLPIRKDEKIKEIRRLERRVYTENQSQVFIEAPYRNQVLFDDFMLACKEGSLLCIACDLTLENEFIQTKSISDWKKKRPDIQKRPAIFILGK